jgi:transcriptional regulator with XRE-family HTH domain
VLHPPPQYFALVRTLARRRKKLRLSQEEACRKIGCADRLVNKWEARMKVISPTMLCWYAQAIGCELVIRVIPKAHVKDDRQLAFPFPELALKKRQSKPLTL